MVLQHPVPLLSTEPPQSMCKRDSFELHSLTLLTIGVFWECDAVSLGFEQTASIIKVQATQAKSPCTAAESLARPGRKQATATKL